MSNPAPLPRWATDVHPAGRPRRRRLLFVLLALVGLTGVTLGVVLWLAVPEPVAFVPVFVTTAPGDAPVPGLDGDRTALLAEGLFATPIVPADANPTRDQLRLRFHGLDRVRAARPLVVGLFAPAGVDATGAVYLLPADPLGDHPRNRLPLAELLTLLGESPARQKLLILHLSTPAESPGTALPPGELSRAVFRTLEAVPDTARLALVACGPGEEPAAVPGLNRTRFGYHLEAGLRGHADGWGPTGDRDGRVTATELAAFVRARVSRWAAPGPPQSPTLVGTGPDFVLRTYPLSDPPAPADPDAFPAPTPYPDWLRAAWDRHPAGPADARAALLAAEAALLADRPAEQVRASLDPRLAESDRRMSEAADVPRPDPLPTLASAFPGYVPPDPALVDTLADLTRNEPAPVAAKAGDPPPPLPAAFEPLLKKPHPELALAAFRVLADDPAPAPARVRRLAELLRTQQPAPRYAETVLIHRLADLAAQPADAGWSPDRAALAAQIARSFEAAVATPGLIARATPAADAAYSLRAAAEGVLFSPGYASAAEADTRLRPAAEAARGLSAAAGQLRAAGAARTAAQSWLDGSAGLVVAGRVPTADADRVAEAVRQLTEVLALPSTLLTAAALGDRARDWQDRAADARASLAAVAAPLAPTALAAVRTRADAGDPAARTDLDLLLASPLVAAGERAGLWDARAKLIHALTVRSLRADAVEDEAIRTKQARPGSTDPKEVVQPAQPDPDRLARQSAWAAAVLRASGRAVPADLATSAEPPAFVARLRLALGTPGDATSNPLRRDNQALWKWQATRFAYEAENPLGLDDGREAFAARAARACAAVAPAPLSPRLDIGRPAEVRLTRDVPDPKVAVPARLSQADNPLRLPVRVLTPDPAWATATVPGWLAAAPLRAIDLPLAVQAGTRPPRRAGLKGLFVEADVGGRPFARRVPLSLDDILNRLDLYTRSGPADAPRELTGLALRPNGLPQPVQFLLGNPTPVPRTVVARLPALNRMAAPVTVEPGGFAPLVFAAPPPASGSAVPPPAAGAPPAEPAFEPLPDQLVVELRDPADPRKPPQTFALPVRVLDPADFLTVEEVTYRPPGTRPNRVEVRVVPGAVPAGPPVAVAVSLPPGWNPNLVQVRDANLSGPLPADRTPLRLYAENLTFARPGDVSLSVAVAADGIERAFTFSGTAPATGGTVRLARDTMPAVAVAAERFAVPAVPLPVRLEVDNAPPGSSVQLRIGVEAAATFVADVVHTVRPAKDRSAAARFDPKGETLFVRGAVRDPDVRVPVGLLAGERTLEARLVDAAGCVLDRTTQTVVFDGTPPTNVRFLDLPPRAGKGLPLPVRATCDPTVSGVDKVTFFLGKAEKGVLPTAPPPAPGQLIAGGAWAAVLQPGKDVDRVTVGVRFTTKAGLSTIETAEVELVDPAELNRPKPGAITGKLVEGGIAQGDHPVFLYDAKRAPLAQAKTTADGTFIFRDLPPGRYVLFAQRVETNREATAEVTVAPAAVTRQDLEMFLPGRP